MSYSERHVLETLIYLPMLAALVLVFVPRPQKTLIRWISIGSGLALLVMSLYAFVAFDYDGGSRFQLQRSYPWLDQLGIAFALGIDGIAAPMVLLTGIVSLAGTIVAANIQRDNKDYYILLFLLIAGVYGTFVSMDLFFFFFFYELAIVPMYLLIGIWGSSSKFKDFDRPKEYGALKLVMVIVAASLLIWIVIIGVHVESGTGSFNIEIIMASIDHPSRFSGTFQSVMFLMTMVGFGTLAGMWPFHTWSPDGHVAAPTSVSMLHAGVLMKLGGFGIIRIGMMLLPDGLQEWALLLFIIGTINVIYGAVSALAQHDLKYVIGYSSVSHMGYVFMGIASMTAVGLTGATLQMFAHGIMTALFFTIVGGIYERTHTRDTLVLNGLASRMKWGTAFFVIAGLASLGLPGLAGFVAELLVFIGAFQTQPILGALGVLGAAITAVYILRLIGRTFYGDRDPKWDNLTDLTRREFIAATILLIPLFYVGLYPQPLLRVIRPGVDAILAGLGL
jgi:NADH-quinone oxidoreductase subunit M